MYKYDSNANAMSILHDDVAFEWLIIWLYFMQNKSCWKGFGNFSAGFVQDGFCKTMLELALSSFYRIEFILGNLEQSQG